MQAPTQVYYNPDATYQVRNGPQYPDSPDDNDRYRFEASDISLEPVVTLIKSTPLPELAFLGEDKTGALSFVQHCLLEDVQYSLNYYSTPLHGRLYQTIETILEEEEFEINGW